MYVKTVTGLSHLIINCDMHIEGWYSCYVYILTNKYRTVLYIGVTGNLPKRLEQHLTKVQESSNTFVARYKCTDLVFYEKYTWIQEAIAREKELKGWRRNKKNDLIASFNPEWKRLNHMFSGYAR